MIYGWRWFGPNDPVKITDVMQTGARCVVSSLHHVPTGSVWSIDEITKRQQEVECDNTTDTSTGLTWMIVESVPVHEDIKKRTGNYKQYIDAYCQTLHNLAQCGIYVVVYNFMPVVDWLRTDLEYRLPNGVEALKFDYYEYVAFDVFILKREGAFSEYPAEVLEKANEVYKTMDEERIEKLTKTIISGLPGSYESYSLEQFRDALSQYKGITPQKLREHLVAFLKEVIPVAEKVGVKLAIHPDDPPWSVFGLPRIMSTASDMCYILKEVPSIYNGLNICAGSLGARDDNDIPSMIKEFGPHVHFVHLRSVKRDGLNFYEDEHVGGSVNLVHVIYAILKEEIRRKQNGQKDYEIPIRPDHGHRMLDDLKKTVNPGYSCIGRVKGLAEIRGIEAALKAYLETTLW